VLVPFSVGLQNIVFKFGHDRSNTSRNRNRNRNSRNRI
jgi:hypothetical protein